MTNANFNAAIPSTYPRRFQIRMGQFDFDQVDHQASGFVQDKWQVNGRLTLNLGVRYDWQRAGEERRTRSGLASASPTI